MRHASTVIVLIAFAGAARADVERPADPKQVFAEASAEYRAGRYDRAIELFERAYELSRAPAILFNIAQAYRLKGLAFCEPALGYYRRSLAEEPDAANRVEIEERMREMQRCLDAQTSATRDAGPERRNRAPLVTAGVGAAAVLGGGILYWRARVVFREAEQSCPCAPGSYDGWAMATNASYVLIGGGAIALGAGLWWWSRSGTTPTVGIMPAPGGAAIAWSGRF